MSGAREWLTAIGLVLTLLGAASGTYGVWLSPDDAIQRGVSRLSGGTREQQLELPAVQNLLQQSHFAIGGFLLIGIGTVLQIGGLTLKNRGRPKMISPEARIGQEKERASARWSKTGVIAAIIGAIAAIAAAVLAFLAWINALGAEPEATMADWPTLIAGLGGGMIGGVFTVVAGYLAYRGALRQVDAVKLQVKDQQDERKKTDDQRRTVAEWAVRAEAERLDKEISRVDPLWLIGAGLTPFVQQEPRLIESSPLLRGEREDAGLLGDKVAILERVASTLNQYNQRVEAAVRTADPYLGELQKVCREFLDQLYALTLELKK